jgi:glycosyltransferase involved in cell wall biosynthesis
MDREVVLGLVNACDAYVSLHRAEGFGRTLAEAMLLGKPVVATDFSGNTDFLDAQHGFPVPWSRRPVEAGEYLFVEPDDQAWWAQPDVGAAAEQLRAARLAARRKGFADAVKLHAKTVFSPEHVGTLMHGRLRQIWASPQADGVSSPQQPPPSLPPPSAVPNPWPEKAARLMHWDALASRPRESDLVSVIIPVLDNPQCTHACLQSLHDQPAGVPFEVVCVDNGSGPVTQRLLAAWLARWPGLRVLTLGANHQFALGCNLGFQASRGARVVFLNNDTEVQPDWLARLVAPLEDEHVMAVQPKLVFDDGKLQCAGVVFAPVQDLGYPLYAGVPATAGWVNRRRDVQAITGACMAVRASDFIRCRGFDPIFINGHEDVDLCLRLVALPWPADADGVTGTTAAVADETRPRRVCRYEPGSVVLHHEGRTPGRHAHLRHNRQTFLSRWKGRIEADDQAHYAADGFEVVRYVKDNPTNDRLGIAISRPELGVRRTPR